jgi:xylan 1,4-beta-xylosidase
VKRDFSNKLKTAYGQLVLIMMLICLTMACSKSGKTPEKKEDKTDETTQKPFYQADPTVFYHNGTYYLSGTNDVNADLGFQVYTSKDMNNWVGPAGAKNGYALVNGDAFGTESFWAPQFFYADNKYHIAYTASGKIAMAESADPKGPFVQTVKQVIPATVGQIDPFVFFDTDGKTYLYHVRLQNGNRIFVAELKPDYSDIKTETLTQCISSAVNPQSWENTANASWTVAEGPTVIKHNGMYYLFYSANDFRNIDYAVGYAVSNSPLGPFTKYTGNPIISRNNLPHNGPGHGDLFTAADGKYYYVLHVHNSKTAVIPRRTAIVAVQFVVNGTGPDKVVIDAQSFKLLSYTNK